MTKTNAEICYNYSNINQIIKDPCDIILENEIDLLKLLVFLLYLFLLSHTCLQRKRVKEREEEAKYIKKTVKCRVNFIFE